MIPVQAAVQASRLVMGFWPPPSRTSSCAEWRDTPYNPVRETRIPQNCLSPVRPAVRAENATFG